MTDGPENDVIVQSPIKPIDPEGELLVEALMMAEPKPLRVALTVTTLEDKEMGTDAGTVSTLGSLLVRNTVAGPICDDLMVNDVGLVATTAKTLPLTVNDGPPLEDRPLATT